MIHLYIWGTPNGRKISILLEELGIAYDIHPVNIGKNEQFEPEFLSISPNNKIPAIVDDEAKDGPLSLFESGAIMTYLADAYGRQFLPAEGHARYKVLEWLFWQVGGQGPMFGQLGWFAVSAPEPNPMAIERYTKEADRLLGVLDKRLSQSPFVGGDYSIADMAIYPWIAQYRIRVKDHIEPLLAKRPHVLAWVDKVAARDAVQRGMLLP